MPALLLPINIPARVSAQSVSQPLSQPVSQSVNQSVKITLPYIISVSVYYLYASAPSYENDFTLRRYFTGITSRLQAKNIPYFAVLNDLPNATLKDEQGLRQAFTAAGIDLDRPTIFNCGSGKVLST